MTQKTKLRIKAIEMAMSEKFDTPLELTVNEVNNYTISVHGQDERQAFLLQEVAKWINQGSEIGYEITHTSHEGQGMTSLNFTYLHYEQFALMATFAATHQ